MTSIKLKQVKIHFKYTSGHRYTVKGNISEFTSEKKVFKYTIKTEKDDHRVTEIHEIPLFDVESITINAPEGYANAKLNGYREVRYNYDNGKFVSTFGSKPV